MKILHTVESYYPEVGGMAEMARQISEGLVKLGHEVTVVTGESVGRKRKTINRVHIKEFNISGKSAILIKGEVKNYQEFLKNSHFDIVTNFAAQTWTTDLMLPILSGIRAKKIFVPVGFSGLYSPIYRKYYQNMKVWMRQYDMNIFLSKDYRDIYFARKNNVQKIKVIPNGASKAEFLAKTKIDIRKKLKIPFDHFLILNVSSHTGLKGHREAIKIFRKANINKSTLLLIGKKTKSIRSCYTQCNLMKNAGSKNILIEDLTRRETVAAFKAADLFLFTSRVECSPIVLFESLAANTPFLTTNVGNAKEIIKWTGGGKLIPTSFDRIGYSRVIVDRSAKILKDFSNKHAKLFSMSKMGHAIWLKKFTWEKIAKEYESVYKFLTKT